MTESQNSSFLAKPLMQNEKQASNSVGRGRKEGFEGNSNFFGGGKTEALNELEWKRSVRSCVGLTWFSALVSF